MPEPPTHPTYVLGTGLSHDGSTVLLRDGVVAVGIEKERITRRKHDGGNDAAAVAYCLEAEGITIDDIDLVVQCGLFTHPDRDDLDGPRPYAARPDLPVVSISHHLAHAYSAVGTCPFAQFDVLVVDGCGSPRELCVDLEPGRASTGSPPEAEQDSYYRWDGHQLTVLRKTFSEFERQWLFDVRLPTTRHSIGGFYAAISHYCFGSLDDVGKLMGLAPLGSSPYLDDVVFDWEDDALRVLDGWKNRLDRPVRGPDDFVERFDHFANVACWAQQQVEIAVEELVRRRRAEFGATPLAYSGGVALNAVANGRLLRHGTVDEFHIEPAAGDNGIALGCAYYGWLTVLGRERVPHDRSTCFGQTYHPSDLDAAVAGLDREAHDIVRHAETSAMVHQVAGCLAAGGIVGWFRDGSEFGPRALGRRSILADPGVPGMRDRINHDVKFREDFRPFAPAVLPDEMATWFVHGWDSPYMILVDQVRPQHACRLTNVVHADGSAHVQTIDPAWNGTFHALVEALRARTGVGVVLNTSFNKRGQPIVERPTEAVALYLESAIDMLVLDDVVITKR